MVCSQYNRLQDWTSLHTEQINATRTIQQVKANVREIEKSRHQVQQCDVEAFDDKIRNMKDGALKAVQEVLNVYQGRSQGNDCLFRSWYYFSTVTVF